MDQDDIFLPPPILPPLPPAVPPVPPVNPVLPPVNPVNPPPVPPANPPPVNPAPPQPMMHLRPMPRRGDKNAPTFSGQPADLDRFLEDVQLCAEEAGIATGTYVIHATRYAPPEIENQWRELPEYEARHWETFCDAVRKLYPGLDKDRKYSVASLDNWVEQYQKSKITSLEQLGAYTRGFLVRANYLVNNRRFSTVEKNRNYLRAFTGDVRDRILHRLQIAAPDQHPDDPYEQSLVYHHAERCLHGTETGITASSISSSSTKDVAAGMVKVEEEMVKLMSNMSQFMTTVQQGQRTATQGYPSGSAGGAGFNRGQAITGLPAARPSFAANPASPDGPSKCHYCGTVGHFARECSASVEDLQKGLIARDHMNRICLPGGMFVPRIYRGEWLRERVMEFHRQNPNYVPQAGVPPPMSSITPATGSNATPVNRAARDPPPHLSANFVSVLEFTKSEDSGAMARIEEVTESDEENEVELERLTALVTAMETRRQEKAAQKGKGKDGAPAKVADKLGKTVRFDGVHVPPLQRSRPGPGKDSTVGESSSASPPMFTPAKPSSTFVRPEKPGDSGPQFRYVSGVDDPKAVVSVMDRMLDAPVTLSQREVLALSPELRKVVKEKITTKKVERSTVAGNSLEALLNSADQGSSGQGGSRDSVWDSSGVVKDSLALRSVEVVLADCVRCEGILDQGAQFVAIRRDVWEATRTALLPDDKITLESADKSKSASLGKIPAIRLRVGTVELTMQAHVVNDAPFEVLIGRPFFAATECQTSDQKTGDQHLILTDPATGSRIMIPTSERRPQSRGQGEVFAVQDF